MARLCAKQGRLTVQREMRKTRFGKSLFSENRGVKLFTRCRFESDRIYGDFLIQEQITAKNLTNLSRFRPPTLW